jgi:tripartite-type tricarboxylate transporter receptor subunit TctC
MVGAMPQMIITHVTAAKPAFHPLRDFAPVAQIVSVDLVLVVNPQKVPATNLQDFAAWTQKQPVSFFGTPGPGSVGHFLATMYGSATTSKVEPVHFKQTGDSVTALLGGEIHALFVTYTVAASLVKSGKLRALAVTSSARSPLFPETPTVREAGYADLEAGSWYGVFAPAGTPPDVLNVLSAEVVMAANSPDMRSKLDEAGMTLAALPRDRFAASMGNDVVRWDRVVKSTGFKTQE